MLRAMSAGNSASAVSATASAEVAAQAIDESASAKVAMRDDEACRWRNWLRRACVRKQSCIKVDEAVVTNMLTPAISAGLTAANASAVTSGAKINPIAPITASILAQMIREAEIG